MPVSGLNIKSSFRNNRIYNHHVYLAALDVLQHPLEIRPIEIRP